MLLKLPVALQRLPQILVAVEQTGLLAHLLAQALTVGKEYLLQGTVCLHLEAGIELGKLEGQ